MAMRFRGHPPFPSSSFDFRWQFGTLPDPVAVSIYPRGMASAELNHVPSDALPVGILDFVVHLGEQWDADDPRLRVIRQVGLLPARATWA